MKELFEAIKAHLLTQLGESCKYVQLWNNQTKDEQEKEGSRVYSFPHPAVLVEFENQLPIEQLGNGVQMYNELHVKLHVIHEHYNADDGTMEQDLPALTLAQDVYRAIQDWMSLTVAAGAFTRINETQDYDHNNIYHFIQTYQTTYVDYSMARPVGGQQFGPVNLEVQLNQLSIESEAGILLMTENDFELTTDPEIILP